MKRLEFIASITPACKVAQAKFGIPWQWLVVQAIQESGGYGLSDLSVNARNLYGIKGKDYYQGSVGYASFKTWSESILFQGWQLGQSRYLPFKPLVVAGRYKEYGDALSQAGWCPVSVPSYGAMIQRIYDDYHELLQEPHASVAMTWATSEGIIDPSGDLTRTVDMETLAWALFKARGKV